MKKVGSQRISSFGFTVAQNHRVIDKTLKEDYNQVPTWEMNLKN